VDKNGILIRLSESDRTDFGRIALAEQCEEQRVFSAIWELESQVNNGGFELFFRNCDLDTIAFAPLALRRIGADKCAGIVDRALTFLSSVRSSYQPNSIERCVASISDEVQTKLCVLDEEFFAYPDSLTELLFDFVRSHPNTFGKIDEPRT
jgi:hypothetical protein